MNLSKADIDLELLDKDEPVVLAEGGNTNGVGYKYTNYYSLTLYYIPSVNTFIVQKSSINGSNYSTAPSLQKAIHRYNRATEETYQHNKESDVRSVSDVHDVPDYVIKEAK